MVSSRAQAAVQRRPGGSAIHDARRVILMGRADELEAGSASRIASGSVLEESSGGKSGLDDAVDFLPTACEGCIFSCNILYSAGS
jgi:hypothetical protein